MLDEGGSIVLVRLAHERIWYDAYACSLTLLRNCLQEDSLPILIGFRPYQGNVWVRDSVWIIATLARTGHPSEALAALRALRKILKRHCDHCNPNGFTSM